MRRVLFIGVLLLVSSMCTLPALAQDSNSKAAKPAPSPSQAVLETWNDVGRKLIAMAEDFPEDKYDFRPTPAERTFAQQLTHAAGANYFFTNIVLGEKPPTEEDMKKEIKTRVEMVAFVKKAVSDGADVIKKKGDKGMNDLVVEPFSKQQTRVGDFAYGFAEHMGEHYGQLVVYYRLSGLVPPESRPKK